MIVFSTCLILCFSLSPHFGLNCLVPTLPKALTEYKAELRDDPIISTHLTKLYDNLLEQNLIRVIEPFSRVQVIFRTLLCIEPQLVHTGAEPYPAYGGFAQCCRINEPDLFQLKNTFL